MRNKFVLPIIEKIIQFSTMEAFKVPDFINTPEKYNQVVRDTDTIQKYEDFFYKLLED